MKVLITCLSWFFAIWLVSGAYRTPTRSQAMSDADRMAALIRLVAKRARGVSGA